MTDSDAQAELEALKARVAELASELEHVKTAAPENSGEPAEGVNWEELLESVEKHVRDYPVGSAIAALGIGVVLGVIVSR